jgi:hypothetical protein
MTNDVLKCINAVSHDISQTGIAKARQNKEQNYSYRGIDDFLNTLSPILAKHGLVIIPRYTHVSSIEVGKTAKGNSVMQATITGEFDLIAVSDGSKVTAVVTGEGRDSADKAISKCLSACYKYMAAQVFCVPFIGMPDAEDDTGSSNEVVIPKITPEALEAIIKRVQSCTSIEDLRALYNGLGAELSADEEAYAKVFAATKIRRAELKK